jgi:hypothetical protein
MLPSGVPALNRDEALELLEQLEGALLALRKTEDAGRGAVTLAHRTERQCPSTVTAQSPRPAFGLRAYVPRSGGQPLPRRFRM